MGESRSPLVGAELRRREEARESVAAGVKLNYGVKQGQISKDGAGDVTTSFPTMPQCLIIPRALFHSSACFFPSSLF